MRASQNQRVDARLLQVGHQAVNGGQVAGEAVEQEHADMAGTFLFRDLNRAAESIAEMNRGVLQTARMFQTLITGEEPRLVNVNEIFHLDLTKTNVVDGQLCVVIRERTLPLYYLRRWLVKGYGHAELPTEGHVVVVQVGTQKVGFLVDELIGQEEVVIKPLGALLHGTAGLAGATITGDGGIAIILDIPSLMRRYGEQR